MYSIRKKVLPNRRLIVAILLFSLFSLFALASLTTLAQNTVPVTEAKASISIAKYIDAARGKTADELVAYALTNNGELLALGKEVEASQALLRQAGLRPNPMLEVNGSKQIGGGDNSLMVAGSLPLELGGRRGARVRVAEGELAVRKQVLADRMRLLAAEVRAKFGESLAFAFKLKFTEDMLVLATNNYNLVAATVSEGRRAPLEQSMETVELNRLRAMRETSEGKVEISMFELRNLVGMPPEEPLFLHGDFEDLLKVLSLRTEAFEQALRQRPDLEAARAAEQLAAARIEQARAGGRLDASVTAGYQRMRTGFPLRGIDEAGNLRSIDSIFNSFTFGVTLELPVRNRNQGAVEAAVADRSAAQGRREFGELTVRREVAVAYSRYESAARAMQIYRVGVREQAAANLSVVRQTYEFGSKPLFDYIAEQRRFIEIENGFIDAQLETYLARVEILRVTNAPELINK
ncbi:MAG: TolC family protein [Pyrinomonadaceae bacterium]